MKQLKYRNFICNIFYYLNEENKKFLNFNYVLQNYVNCIVFFPFLFFCEYVNCFVKSYISL